MVNASNDGRLIKILEMRKNRCQLTADDYEELLSLIWAYLTRDRLDRIFVIEVLRDYLNEKGNEL